MTAHYVVLARKYRPQTFEDIVGQHHVTATLQKAIEGGRVHHAYLFSGIRGVGKTTAARVVAKALNCVHGPTPQPCNQCAPCLEITAGKCMDVIEMDAASNRGIDDIRELREGVRYSTNRDRFRILIIDEVHMLTEPAFNALLKTLEEPPAHVRFILATTDPQKVPATILSRCQRFDFRRVAAGAMVAHLASICEKEGIRAEEGALAVVVRQTTGSVRDCLSLLDQLLAGADGNLTEAYAREILGIADGAHVFDTLSCLLAGDAAGALRSLRSVYLSGLDIQMFMGELLQLLRDAMVFRAVGPSDELLDLTQGEMRELAALVGNRSTADMHYYFQVFLRAMEEIARSEFPLFAAEEALVRVATAGSVLDVASLVQQLDGLEGKGPGTVQVVQLTSATCAHATVRPPAPPAGDPGAGRLCEPTVLSGRAESAVTAEPPQLLEPVPLDRPSGQQALREPGLQPSSGDVGQVEAEADGAVLGTPVRPEFVLEKGVARLDDSPEMPESVSASNEVAGELSAGEEEELLPEEGPTQPDSLEDSMTSEEQTGAAVVARRPGSASQADILVQFKSLEQFWVEFVAKLREWKDPLTARVAEEGLPVSITEEGVLVLQVPRGVGSILRTAELEGRLEQFLGNVLFVRMQEQGEHELTGSIATLRRKRFAGEVARRAEALKNEPALKVLGDLFGARVRSVIPEPPEEKKE